MRMSAILRSSRSIRRRTSSIGIASIQVLYESWVIVVSWCAVVSELLRNHGWVRLSARVVSGRDTDVARARTQIDDLESQLADLRERLTTLEAAVEAIPGGGATPPARSLRRATARRASRRRHEARALQ